MLNYDAEFGAVQRSEFTNGCFPSFWLAECRSLLFLNEPKTQLIESDDEQQDEATGHILEGNTEE